MKPTNALKLFKAFFALMFDDESLRTVGEMSDVLVETHAFDLAAQYLKRDYACDALIHDRYIPPAHDLGQLLTSPQNSLGYIYAKTMKKSGFDPNLHADMTTESDAKYVQLRLSQTHDIWHIITGFNTSEVGEIGLQAFYLAQLPSPLAAILVANSLIYNTLIAPEELSSLLDMIMKGLDMGRRANALFPQKWEEAWDRPLTEWQSGLNIQPIQSKLL